MNNVICPHCKEELDGIISFQSIQAGQVMHTYNLENTNSEEKQAIYSDTDYIVKKDSFDGFFCPYCVEELSEEDLKKMGIRLPQLLVSTFNLHTKS